jgi:hypothetical protein
VRGDIETVRHRQVAMLRTFAEGVLVGALATLTALLVTGALRP